MHLTLDKQPAIVRNWLDKARLAPTLAEAAFYHRKAQIALGSRQAARRVN
jgi:hypothetical protein